MVSKKKLCKGTFRGGARPRGGRGGALGAHNVVGIDPPTPPQGSHSPQMRYSDRRLEAFCEINIVLVVDFPESGPNLASLAWGQQIGDNNGRRQTLGMVGKDPSVSWLLDWYRMATGIHLTNEGGVFGPLPQIGDTMTLIELMQLVLVGLKEHHDETLRNTTAGTTTLRKLNEQITDGVIETLKANGEIPDTESEADEIVEVSKALREQVKKLDNITL